MSNIITTRDPDIIAAEINIIKKKVRETVIFASIEIGQKLTEAKSLVNYGEWGKWLEENVEYSQSTANYLMQLYQEYGTGQESLFDTWTNSQTFAKLTYSQHIALLALPFGERQEFAEQNDVENMSTRQLQQAIKERDEAMQAKAAAEQQCAAAGDKVLEMEQEAKTFRDQAAQTEKELVRAEQSEKKALGLVDKLNKQLEKARKQEDALREELKKAQENPEIPDSIMEQTRKEIEADAAKRATEDIQKQLDAAQQAARDAAKARETAEAQARETEEKLVAAQRAAKMQNPDVAVFQTLYIQLQETWNRTVGAYQKVRQADEGSAESCRRALNAAISKFQSDIAG